MRLVLSTAATITFYRWGLAHYYWTASHRLWLIALGPRFTFRYARTRFTRGLQIGPLTIALTDLTYA